MNKDEKRSIIAGLYGNAIEWYDFLLYASFAPLFADIFFPLSVPYLSLVATFAVFAIGFLIRPIGGIILGHLGDRFGRRVALIVSVYLMTLSTFCIALLPGYKQAGVLAPGLFILLRLLQGLAVGGELPGAVTFLVEHMAANRRGLAGSLVLSTAFFGIFVGSFVAALLSHIFTDAHMYYWGWRWAYVLGGLLGGLGIYLRYKSLESPVFLEASPLTELPMKCVFVSHKKALFIAILFTSILAMSNYLLMGYMTTFLVRSQGFLLKESLTINFIALLAITVSIPFMGLLSDIWGLKRVFLLGIIGILVLIFPIFALILSKSWWLILLGELLLALVLAPINASVPGLLVEMFPTPVRATGVALGYNIGQAIFGGTMPLVAFTLVEYTGKLVSPAWYVFSMALLVLTIGRAKGPTHG